MKNLNSSLGWSLITVVYPAAHAGTAMGAGHWLGFVAMFGAVWMTEIIWDIRDLDGDRKTGVRTLPVVMGVPAAWRWVAAIDLFSAAVVLGGIYLGCCRASGSWYFSTTPLSPCGPGAEGGK